jgi:hypothetical protein
VTSKSSPGAGRRDSVSKKQEKSYRQIWAEFKAEFLPKGLRERELREIHLRWINARAYADRTSP